MKTILLSLLLCVIPILGSGFNDLDKELQSFYSKNSVKGVATKIDDNTWIRRTYLNVAGRIPTLKEINEFAQYKSPTKKEKVIDKVLNSEDYVNNLYNFWADILRIRPERLSDDVGLLKSYPYMDYVRNSIRTDKPYNKFVYDLLTATGRYSDNGATGYILRDNGTPLDNLATTLQIFTATDLSCAQCHDDPFQDYTQRQFFEMAAFFTTVDNRESRREYGDILKRVDQEIKEITKKDRIDNGVRQLLASNLFNLKNNDGKMIKLPHDYKYKDGKPFEEVVPVSLDGRIKNTTKDKRDTISEWITTHDNFSYAIANRMWKHIVGAPLINPEINFIINDHKEGQVVKYLGDYLESHNYSVRELIRHIISSDFYNRVAYTGNMVNYNHQSVLVQRLSAYQLWDSILTFILPDTNYSRVVFQKYADLIEIDWANVNGKLLLDKMEDIRKYDREMSVNFLKYKNIELVRSAYVMNKNSFVGQFLKEYGSSDRILIDSSDNGGSITQLLVMMNSPVMELVTSKESLITNLDKKDIFLTVYSRLPTLEEKDLITKTEEKDLIWALVNSREFLFKK